jgi:hypothetical protein
MGMPPRLPEGVHGGMEGVLIMTVAQIVVGGLWLIAAAFIAAGVVELWRAERHWKEFEKIMSDLERKDG